MLRKGLPPVVALLAVAGLAGCGDDEPTAEPTTTPSSAAVSSSSSSPSTSGAATAAVPASSPPSLPAGCRPPTSDVTFTSGVATVDVTSGPGAGQFDVTVQPKDRNEYRASGRDLKGEWKDPASGNLLYINVSGGDPCKAEPSAFVRIEPQGSSGPAFADSGRNRCKVQIKAFTGEGVDGSFTCTQLGGGGEGVFIDANGTFFLRA